MVADFFGDRENMNDYKYMCVYKNIHKYVFLNIKNSFFFTVCVCVCIMNATLLEQYGIFKVCQVIAIKRNQLCSIV